MRKTITIITAEGHMTAQNCPLHGEQEEEKEQARAARLCPFSGSQPSVQCCLHSAQVVSPELMWLVFCDILMGTPKVNS